MEKLIHRTDIHVPVDLDIGSEPQCDTLNVWQLPMHTNALRELCIGSNNLIYTTDLTNEEPPTAPCNFCNKVFSQ